MSAHAGAGQRSTVLSRCKERLDMTTRKLERQAAKYRKSYAFNKKQCKRAMEIGDEVKARQYAERAISHKNLASRYDALASRMNATKERVTSAQVNRCIGAEMFRVVRALERSHKLSDPQIVAGVMDKFEHVSEEMEVASGLMDSSLKSSASSVTSFSEVNNMISEVALDSNLDLSILDAYMKDDNVGDPHYDNFARDSARTSDDCTKEKDPLATIMQAPSPPRLIPQ